jgi:hypothetical protein
VLKHSSRHSVFLALACLALGVGPASAGASSTAGARAARLTVVEFHAPSTSGKEITCAMYDRPGEPASVLCESYGPGRESTATLDPQGRVGLCATYNFRTKPCPIGNAGTGTWTFHYGHQVTVGRFHCAVTRQGVECRIIATGAGFLFNPRAASRIGGATPAPLTLSEFRSPDHEVWCEAGTFCGTGGAKGTPPDSRVSLAQFGADGKVTTCVLAHDVPPGECLQNWNEAAPVLPYGRQDEYDGVLCTSATDGITCIKVAGSGLGAGFRINKSELVEIG